ncbi:MAG: hypothetical protein II643_04260 [Oscillospiraceae bacterium]|nr:hypothetical protein [Oscillospiraceae bacterium]
MKCWSYDGPVMAFDICVAPRWVGVTYAMTEAKARNNLTFQAKKMLNKIPNTKVTLPGKIKLVG